MGKRHLAALVLPVDVTLVGARGKPHASHRHEHQLAGSMRRRLLQVHHRRRDQANVPKVGKRQRDGVVIVVYEIVVPVLDAPARRGDAVVAVVEGRPQRIARLAQATLLVKQRTGTGNEMLRHGETPSLYPDGSRARRATQPTRRGRRNRLVPRVRPDVERSTHVRTYLLRYAIITCRSSAFPSM